MTMTRLAGSALLCALITLPACNQIQSWLPGQGSSRPAAMSSATPTAASFSAAEYVRKAAIGDQFEIESSRVALSQSSDPQVQQFARTMIDHHTRMSSQLQRAVRETNPTMELPTTLDLEHQDMMDQLMSARGQEFDRRYITIQTQAHQDALQLHSSYMNSGDQPRLREVARAAVPTIQSHLDQVRMLQGQ